MNRPNLTLLDATNENAIEAEGGTLSITRLPENGQGSLRRFLINDLSSSAEGYTVAMYCSKRAFNAGLTALSANSETYRIFPLQTAEAAARVAEWEGDRAYMNADGDAIMRERYLYLVINPAGSGDKVFEVQLLTTPGAHAF